MFHWPVPRKSLQNYCENNSKISAIMTDHRGQAYFCPYFNVELELWSQFIPATNIRSIYIFFAVLFLAGILYLDFLHFNSSTGKKKKNGKRKATLTCLWHLEMKAFGASNKQAWSLQWTSLLNSCLNPAGTVNSDSTFPCGKASAHTRCLPPSLAWVVK